MTGEKTPVPPTIVFCVVEHFSTLKTEYVARLDIGQIVLVWKKTLVSGL